MTKKAYIVANEQQESEVLEKLEREGLKWKGFSQEPTEQHRLIDEPITIFARDDKQLMFDSGVNEAYLTDYEIVYDGRKEQQMSEKYVVSQEFMNELEWWKINLPRVGTYYVDDENIYDISSVIRNWWKEDNRAIEQNNRLIAIIRWVNGEDIFEVEKPKKWVVRSKERDSDGDYWYVESTNNLTYIVFYENDATKFDTKEEAKSWANAHQEVVQVEVD